MTVTMLMRKTADAAQGAVARVAPSRRSWVAPAVLAVAALGLFPGQASHNHRGFCPPGYVEVDTVTSPTVTGPFQPYFLILHRTCVHHGAV